MTVQTSAWPSATSQGALSVHDAALYLKRIEVELDASSPPPPSLELLRQLQSSHILAVPFESTTLHCSNWHNDDDEIQLGGGHHVALGAEAFHRIVHLRRGGYCFSLNSTFALLLRFFGFRVSELAARVFANLGGNPEEVGWAWSPTSHQCAVVDWEGSDGRWFVDVGFGSAQSAYPIPFHDEATQASIPSSDLFTLRRHDSLPLSSAPSPVDAVPYWILMHQETSPAPERKGYWSPVYAFTLSTVAQPDFVVYNHYNSTHPSAVFRTFFVCTRLAANGTRTTLYWKEGMADESSCRRVAKLQTTSVGKMDEGGKQEEELVEMRVGPIRRVLERSFGMLFPEEYSGN